MIVVIIGAVIGVLVLIFFTLRQIMKWGLTLA